jgi:hypothetical protein
MGIKRVNFRYWTAHIDLKSLAARKKFGQSTKWSKIWVSWQCRLCDVEWRQPSNVNLVTQPSGPGELVKSTRQNYQIAK